MADTTGMADPADTMTADDGQADRGRNDPDRRNNPDDCRSLSRAGSRPSSHAGRRALISGVMVIVAVVALVATLVISNHMQQDSRRVDAARTACSQSVTALTKARTSLSRRIAQARKDGLGGLTAQDVADPATVSDFAQQLSASQTSLGKAKKPASCAVPSGSSEARISALTTARKKNRTMTDSLEQQEKRLKKVIEALTKSRDAKKQSGAGSAGQAESGSAGSGPDGGTTGSGSGSGSGSDSTNSGSAGSNGGSGSNSLDGTGPGSPVRKDKTSPYKPNLDKIPEQPR